MFDLTGKERSPLEALSRVRFGGKTYLLSTLVWVLITPTVIVKNNANRVFWLMLNANADDLFILPSGDSFISSFITLPARGGVFSLSFEEDGETVGYEWNGYMAVANHWIRLMEVIRA